jgi:hypothetical protein
MDSLRQPRYYVYLVQGAIVRGNTIVHSGRNSINLVLAGTLETPI